MTKSHPHIQVPPAITAAIKNHVGVPSVITMMVKYRKESDWVSERLWMVPGWDATELWKKAYKWLYNDARLMYYDQSEIEAVRFYKFKLV